MKEEIDSIWENQTRELTELPGHRAIGLKWVYKIKNDEAGVVIKYKARLVAKGYVQQASVDFEEVFAPVARMESIRLVLALVADEGWVVHNMDMKTVFLNEELTEEVCVQQPQGFAIVGEEGKVLRLRRALRFASGAPSVVRKAQRNAEKARVSPEQARARHLLQEQGWRRPAHRRCVRRRPHHHRDNGGRDREVQGGDEATIQDGQSRFAHLLPRIGDWRSSRVLTALTYAKHTMSCGY
jgi:hypothetical protein